MYINPSAGGHITYTNFSDTTLIIGAGAHVPYDYPASNDLTAQIKSLRFTTPIKSLNFSLITIKKEELRDKIKICRLMQKLQIISLSDQYDVKTIEALDSFLDKFAEAQVESIDAFLAQRSHSNQKDFQTIKIGKLIIAYFISKYERKNKIGYGSANWIQYIIQNFLKNSELRDQFFENPPKIFTFNYDNHLERSLFAHLKSYHQIPSEKATELIKKLDITHVYGHLDSLGYDFDDKNVDFYERCINNIKVVDEERGSDTSKISALVLKAIDSSKKIYFLGFKFDPLNVKVLFNGYETKYSTMSKKYFYATHVNLTPRERTTISDLLEFKLEFPGQKQCCCVTLIREERPIFANDERKTPMPIPESGGGGSQGWMG